MTLSVNDVWALAGDRRFSNLDMPILKDSQAYGAKADRAVKAAKLIKLSTDIPRAAGSFKALVRGLDSASDELSFERKLSSVLRYLAAPLRHEPLNLPHVHFPVSSFGGLFSCGVYLVKTSISAGASVDVYYYHANYHALELVQSAVPFAQSIEQDELQIVLVGQYWTVARKYGEYAPYGVSLDSGIAFAQLQYLLKSFNLAPKQVSTSIKSLNDLLLPEESCQRALAATSIRVSAAETSFLARQESTSIAHWAEPKGIYQQFDLLKEVVEVFSAELPAKSVSNGKSYQRNWLNQPSQLGHLPEKDFIDVVADRTAANDHIGFSQSHQQVSETFLTDFLSVLDGLQCQRCEMPAAELLKLTTAWLNPHGREIGLYDEQANVIYTPSNKASFISDIQDCLYNDQQKYNLSTLAMEMFISVDLAEIDKHYQQSSVRCAHMAAGALVHDICLVASYFDCFARPVRMFRDTNLQQKLALDGQLIIQVLVGFNRHHNFTMRLL